MIPRIRLRPGELLLAVRGTGAFPGDTGIVFMLGHTDDGNLYVAPLGASPFQDPLWPHPMSPMWVGVGPARDLPSDHVLGDLADAYRRAVAACN